jgi:proteasome lid subunit RPN8/RPN11
MKPIKNIVLIITNNCQFSIIHCQFIRHYAYNSPLTYRDPSGLAPEKEKEGEELMGVYIPWEYIYGIWNSINAENDRRSGMRMTNADGSLMTGCNFGDGFDENGNSLITGTKGYTGGRGSRKGGAQSSAANGQGGSVSSGNTSDDNNGSPTYAGTLFVAPPKDFSEESWDETLKNSGAYDVLNVLQKENPEKEVGFFIRKDGDNYFADYFIGIDKDTWMKDIAVNPYHWKFGSNEMIIGFVHTHPCHTDMFSKEDRWAIKETSLGKIGWMNRPYISRNYDPVSLDMQFYAVCYGGLYNISRFRDILSWYSATSSSMMIQFRNEITTIGRTTFHFNHYKVSEFLKRK